ncbi:hypothetical protein LRU_01947 [Ligilactobacillus ruminis SPM0211]|uniref:Uncharacterized protein n=1 Tax=Ligilactobacillus ruminis SPM0211 TaxID=1040964 RepID=F7R2L6_9LACO|nr:hypothetical protein LRU_01947 [Ligilactobacillus ruminis SPM0211]
MSFFSGTPALFFQSTRPLELPPQTKEEAADAVSNRMSLTRIPSDP